eukprot:CAMPEP_0181202046 /NCGR_PEP_ID=MMETSP1096-20121128/18629_1 /TAXON_ID=156174 ORGANISM="Chrysochromulina ericina, Strain CCMP281" /NCGR_SAMPLE_ID=MMETSP1096 /ASSEMBLY_ACC=CAM_ASM_000453 /LENGTH=84 /DNA_ID=CAMNT_0023292525 /DNA_START=143 /DNA_END=397 /DNA_ORIENTATION=+
MEEVAKHDSKTDCWIIVDGLVYDITAFLEEHPGGRRLPAKYAGKDATEVWNEIHGHKKELILRAHSHLVIGSVKSSAAGPKSKL